MTICFPVNVTTCVSTLQRPCSAIRPLSGRVFMRRMEHGWVAKHYPDSGSNSHTNMDTELEDLSDCDSLDSFFEEEFDDRDHNEKLNNLLSCNTIAGDSKVYTQYNILHIVGNFGEHYICPEWVIAI